MGREKQKGRKSERKDAGGGIKCVRMKESNSIQTAEPSRVSFCGAIRAGQALDLFCSVK